ncbi:hypothetical protein EVAR_83799_1 [Eumeta japonica]|uniref:Uncharacterized protein n=1 Tax=Eumeta variegata TaxID=151549 RepID=A0A4C1WG76_EUMVA|nr:hypothetical protein EVAR_83799_1 [Eumeta japonica]
MDAIYTYFDSAFKRDHKIIWKKVSVLETTAIKDGYCMPLRAPTSGVHQGARPTLAGRGARPAPAPCTTQHRFF